MSNVSNAVKRREIRKEKILKNAELRKQKIFGIGLSDSSADVNTYDKNSSSVNEGDISDAATQQYSLLTEKKLRVSADKCANFENSFDVNNSNNSDEIEKLNDYLRSIPDPLIEINNKTKVEDEFPVSFGLNYSSRSCDSSALEENDSIFTNSVNLSEGLSRTSFLSTSANSQSGSKLYNLGDKRTYVESSQSLYLFDHPVALCLLALLVSLLLTFNFDSLVSHSLLVPFCIWELQQFISIYGSNRNNQNKTNFLISALLLCGIKKDAIEKYIWISVVFRDIIEDFSVYIFTIVIWHLLIGFPNEASHS